MKFDYLEDKLPALLEEIIKFLKNAFAYVEKMLPKAEYGFEKYAE